MKKNRLFTKNYLAILQMFDKKMRIFPPLTVPSQKTVKHEINVLATTALALRFLSQDQGIFSIFLMQWFYLIWFV
jgi:hypothetical protein